MRKRQAAVALLGGVGLMTLMPAPAMAGNKPEPPRNLQIIGIQTCRSVDIVGLGAAIHNLLGIEDEHGDCVNGGELEKYHNKYVGNYPEKYHNKYVGHYRARTR